MLEEVLAKDLPRSLVESVVEGLIRFTVAFVDLKVVEGKRVPVLRGSGVLVSAAGHRAILTAQHVIKALPKDERLCVLLEKTAEPHTLDRAGLVMHPIARGTVDASGPDLGAILLAPTIAGTIAAKKSFANLDTWRDRLLSTPPDVHDGIWFTQGFLDERTAVSQDADGGTTTRFYNWTGFGGPDGPVERDGFDYFEFPVTGDRSEVPASWGGMSGGSVWQVQLKREGGELIAKPPILSGILFYQRPTTPTECGVVSHAWRSIYQNAYDVVARREA